ncbi:general L-amino acid transport system permease protein [Pararhizobium capsulatum DSM 1112]|uniref:General L-amino acid transport system permease protein n=1 Tax=Pararhizobium capsulatum DSM 1112 TaxID=1121113 RepID=A0ABU0BY76_9HYPH|nr:ABC transporter permease subunit [Pararhizobium capsulatum]MDQ0323219.1 general L-amino acid transport system permease protein [Pararhizobium capsulatum DSM 1112]
MKYTGREAVSSIAVQMLLILAVGGLGWFLVATTLENLEFRGVSTGFSFLWRVVSMPIANSWIEFVPGLHTYARALLVGLLNTLSVSGVVIVASTIVGSVIGISRLSPNLLLSKTCGAYVEAVRNVPVLLQLVFWYQLILELPAPRSAFKLAEGIFISNRGIRYPALGDETAVVIAVSTIAVLIIAFVFAAGLQRKGRVRLGRWLSLPAFLTLAIFLPIAAIHFSGHLRTPDVPVLKGLNFRGGATLTPELSALTIGLSIYTSAFIAEIVRAGVVGVPAGQREAAMALGIGPFVTLRKVIIPQALRIVIPPLSGEYLGVIKNSSLAVAVGYPDLFAIVNSMISDTGQAVEGVTIIILAFLTMSLAISTLMNWCNRCVALVTR